MYWCWVSQMLTDSFFFCFFFPSPLLSLKLCSFHGLVPGPFFPSLSFAPELLSYLISSLWTLHSDSSHHSGLQEIWSHCSCSNCSCMFPLSLLSHLFCFNGSPSLLVSIYPASVQMVSSYLLSSVVVSIGCLSFPLCLSAFKQRSLGVQKEETSGRCIP